MEAFKDGTSISVEDDYILIDVEELNAEFGNENFEIQIFKKSTKHPGLGKSTKEETWEPLFFEEQEEEIDENGMLVDQFEDPEDDLTSMSKIYVSHYLEILTDKEIPQFLLCLPPDEGRLNIFGRQKIDCAEQSLEDLREISDIYASNYEDEVEYCADDEE